MTFDVKSQEWDYYRAILNAPGMTVPEYGVRGEIALMTAERYIREISRITRTSYESHMRILKFEKADRKNIEYLKTLDFPIAVPVINYTCGAQEGRHRAIAYSELYGEGAEFPCLCVRWIDERRRGLTFWRWLARRREIDCVFSSKKLNLSVNG